MQGLIGREDLTDRQTEKVMSIYYKDSTIKMLRVLKDEYTVNVETRDKDETDIDKEREREGTYKRTDRLQK